ncbi:hypothetical protein K5B08_01420, partial [Candidatus Carsonella ruddii]|nr:hypothetical protein [Candidatus Carsonella ruddii]
MNNVDVYKNLNSETIKKYKLRKGCVCKHYMNLFFIFIFIFLNKIKEKKIVHSIGDILRALIRVSNIWVLRSLVN